MTGGVRLAFAPAVPQVSRSLTGDGVLLFATRSVRMFAYGFLSVVLVLYLKAVGLTEEQIGLLLTMTLLGDTVISLWITTAADRIGRKRMLILGALLMALVGGVFAVDQQYLVLLVLSPRSACSAPATRKSDHSSRSSRRHSRRRSPMRDVPPSSPGTTSSAPSRRRSGHLSVASPVGSSSEPG